MHALMHIPAGCNTSRLPNEVPKSQLKEEVSKKYLNNKVQIFPFIKNSRLGMAITRRRIRTTPRRREKK
jgi:hypothetical protein